MKRSLFVFVFLLIARPGLTQPLTASQQPRPAEPRVASANQAVLTQLPFADRQDFEDANRGFIATSSAGRSPDQYAFLAQEPPPTVNPSLWRQAQLNEINGLFRVTDGVYQIRGFSLANMTIIEGASGVIVIDTLSTIAAARAGMDLYFANRPRRPVVAVVYTHSHADHYSGVKGVTSDADVRAGRTKVYAPAGFMKEVVSESVIAGTAMARRAQYQFGGPLPRGERGNVDAGLGKDSRGEPGTSLIAPTDSIEQPIETRTIDGVTMVFQLAPATEAPAEMHIFLPQSHVLDMAENATHNLHNLLPLRGTEIRDAKGWSHFLSEALERFGADSQVMIAQHHWPVWGGERVAERLGNHRDLYKYVHDQTVRMMNLGYAPADIQYFALSHFHWDHVGNANLFAGATWLVQKSDRDVMFGSPPSPRTEPQNFSALKNSKTTYITANDYDVFGDGTVVIKATPGHSPGHQSLFLKLAKTGPVVISGDLYHYPEERKLNRIPTTEFNAQMTVASRASLEAFLKKTGAQLWIQHDYAADAKLKKSPAFYE